MTQDKDRERYIRSIVDHLEEYIKALISDNTTPGGDMMAVETTKAELLELMLEDEHE